MQPAHPGKKHIRIPFPQDRASALYWVQINSAHIRSFSLDVTAGPRKSPRNQYLDVYYEPGQETVIIEEVLRYAGVISVCRTGFILD